MQKLYCSRLNPETISSPDVLLSFKFSTYFLNTFFYIPTFSLLLAENFQKNMLRWFTANHKFPDMEIFQVEVNKIECSIPEF